MRGAEKWHFILRLDNCFCNLVKMTRMGKDSLAWLSCQSPVVISYSAHPHYDTSISIVATLHECFRIFSLKVSDTHHSSNVSFIVLGYWDCFPLPFTKEGRDVITACDWREFTLVRALMFQGMKIPGPSCIEIFLIFGFSCLFPFLGSSTFQSQGLAMSRH